MIVSLASAEHVLAAFGHWGRLPSGQPHSLAAAATTAPASGRYMAAMAGLASIPMAGTGGGVKNVGGACSASQAASVILAQMVAPKPHSGWSKSTTSRRPVLRTDSVTPATSQ